MVTQTKRGRERGWTYLGVSVRHPGGTAKGTGNKNMLGSHALNGAAAAAAAVGGSVGVAVAAV